MSRQINAGAYRRNELFLIDPEEIEVDWSKNSRAFPELEKEEEAIRGMMESLRSRGQISPVKVRMVANKRVQLVAGYRRHEARRRLNLQLPADKRVLLACVVADENEEESFLDNLAENIQRENYSPMDQAFIARRLRQDYGKQDDEIRGIFGRPESMSQSWLDGRFSLLQLPTDVQLLVHTNKMRVEAAFIYLKSKEEKKEEVLQTAKEMAPELPAKSAPAPVPVVLPAASSAPTVAPPRKQKVIRAKDMMKAAREKGALTQPISRRASDWKQFWEPLTGPGCKVGTRKIAKAALQWQAGEIDDKELEKTVERNTVG